MEQSGLGGVNESGGGQVLLPAIDLEQPLIYSRQEIEDWQRSPGHISTVAMREGLVLYG